MLEKYQIICARMQKNVLKRDTENAIIVVVSHVWLAMSNRQEKAWQDIQCYIECHDYGISCGFLEKYYKMFYLPGLYVNPIILDIIENNKEACKLLFED